MRLFLCKLLVSIHAVAWLWTGTETVVFSQCYHLLSLDNLALISLAMTRIIAISLSKGGVGKTTTAVNLSACLSQRGKSVLLVDTDTQGQASRVLGVNHNAGLADYLLGEVDAAAAIVEARSGLYMMTGGYKLAGVKQVIASKSINPQLTLSKAMRPINTLFDYVIIDTSPGWDNLAINVLFYARELLCPVNLETMAIDGLLAFLERLGEIQEDHDLMLRYVVPTALDRRVKQTGEIMSQLKAHFGNVLCEPIRYNVRLSEAPAHGQHIFEYAPKAAGAIDYRALAEKVLKDE